MTTKGDKELGKRIQAAIEASGLTRAKAAEKVGMDQSHLARVCYGERSIDRKRLEQLAEVLHVELSSLTGSSEGESSETGNSRLATSAPGASVDLGRQGRGRAAFIEGHRDELSRIEVEFLSEVEISAGGRSIEPADEAAWWSLLDWFREEQKAARRGR